MTNPISSEIRDRLIVIFSELENLRNELRQIYHEVKDKDKDSASHIDNSITGIETAQTELNNI